jgi:pyruvate dehydrogenase E1 component
VPFIKPAGRQPGDEVPAERREALGGYLPQRRRTSSTARDPPLCPRSTRCSKATGEGREISTTMAFVRMLTTLLRDKEIGRASCRSCRRGAHLRHGRHVPPDRHLRQVGQLYKPQDADQLMYYREAKDGQILQEGINEAGAMASWIAAATSYSTSNVPMIPFYIYYSMFGFQRVGDLAGRPATCGARLPARRHRRPHHAQRRRPAARGRPQPRAGLAPSRTASPTTRPSPTSGGDHAATACGACSSEQEDVFYYITLMNENYFTVLGTDGFGRSDTREHLRNFFEVDRYWIAHAALAALAKDGKVNAKDVARAIREYKLDPDKPNPQSV